MAPEPQLFHAPDDLRLVNDADLSALQEQGTQEFNRVRGLENISDSDIAYAQRITADLGRIKAEMQERTDRATREAEMAKQTRERQMAALNDEVNGPSEPAVTATTTAQGVDLEAVTEAAARGVAMVLHGGNQSRAFASLSATRERAPQVKVPESPTSVVTASVDIPGVAAGQTLPTMEALTEAFRAKAKAIPTTRDGKGAARHLVASVKNTFEHTLDNRTNPAQVEELWHAMVNHNTTEALVAGGGWCAPSEIRYEFFNIADPPVGMIDLPTVGISRGGIRFPSSPAIGDVFFNASVGGGQIAATGFGGFSRALSNATDPWLWSESDDILTVTGSVNKPTLRVPCPTFSEVRLECYGISLTAGNLTDDAYPESTTNFIRLLRAAYAHAINGRLISLMDTAAGAATTTGEYAAQDAPVFQQILSGAALAAADYRARYAMRNDSVLELVIPYWVLDVIRADLVWRTGVDMLSVSDATIKGYFADRNLRVQFVDDYQVRGASQFGGSTNMTAWPTQVDFLLYAAGTFLHGTGLSLDLGVIRDSVLNAENDYTALWAEECHLIALVGHAARKYTTTFNVMGATSVVTLSPVASGQSIDAFPNL